MNILDFMESDSRFDDYYVYETVWGKKTLINVVVENENDDELPEFDGFNVGKLIRPLKQKLVFVENNRALIEKTIMDAISNEENEFLEDIDGISGEELKTLYIDEMLYSYFDDTGNCELGLYLVSDTDCLDGGTLILNVKNDNTVELEDFM